MDFAGSVDSKVELLCEPDRGDMGRLRQQVEKRREAEALVSALTEEGCNSDRRKRKLEEQKQRVADADSMIDEISEGAVAKRMCQVDEAVVQLANKLDRLAEQRMQASFFARRCEER